MAENLFDVVFFPDTDPLSGAKEILSEVSAICSKNDTFSGGVPATVKPGQQRRGFFFTVEEFETYKAESGLTDMEGLEGLQNGYVEERSGYYQEHYGESE